ncbi:hypothetical protein BDF14DRAFT_1886160 [Spinellus fusiger]|nr:hypothetical protein BDF14DRAFT_1886160 [Spinellus fusiger]
MEGRPKRHHAVDKDYREHKRLRKDDKSFEEGDIQEDNVLVLCSQLIQLLCELVDPEDQEYLVCTHFMQLPSKRLYSDYYDTKIDQRDYTSLAQLKSDIELMVANAKKYNRKESQVFDDAVQIQKFVKSWQPGIKRDRHDRSTKPTTASTTASTSSNNTTTTTSSMSSMSSMSNSSNSSRIKTVLKLPREAFENRRSQPENKIKAIKLKAVEKQTPKKAITKRETKRALDLLASDPTLDPNELVQVEMFNDTFTWGPLHSAAYYGDVKVCQALLGCGADVELSDTWYSATPLGWAAFGDREKVVRMLVENYSANIKARNIHGQIPLDVVSDAQDPKWIGLLKGPFPSKPSKTVETKFIETKATDPQPQTQPSQPQTHHAQTVEERLPTTLVLKPPPPLPPPQQQQQQQIKPVESVQLLADPAKVYHEGHTETPPKKRRGRPPKSESEHLLALRPIEEIDLDDFDPVGYMKDLFHSIRTHTDNNGRLYSEIFETLPGRKEYPDYFRLIKDPRSLAMVDDKMHACAYKNLAEWMADMELVFQNALDYNEPGSRVYRDAKLLLRLLYRLKDRSMAREGVPVSQEKDVMTMLLADRPFDTSSSSDEKRRNKRPMPKMRTSVESSTEPELMSLNTHPVPRSLVNIGVMPGLPPRTMQMPSQLRMQMPHVTPSYPVPDRTVFTMSHGARLPAERIAQEVYMRMNSTVENNFQMQHDPSLAQISSASLKFFQVFHSDMHKVRMLNNTTITSTDQPFSISVKGDYMGHSMTLPSKIQTIKIMPNLLQVLRTEHKRVAITVLQNNNKLKLIEESNQDTISPCWISTLSKGMNTIKINITANITQPETIIPDYRSQTYVLFIVSAW